MLAIRKCGIDNTQEHKGVSMETREEKVLPVPKNVVEFVQKSKAKKAIERMQLENMLLKHLIETLDPIHDYVFDDEEMELKKVKRGEGVPSEFDEEAGKLKPETDSKKPFRGTVELGA